VERAPYAAISKLAPLQPLQTPQGASGRSGSRFCSDRCSMIAKPASRSGSIGFGAKVIAPEDRKQGEIFGDVEPEDLLKYGAI
jgi:hypothetical protein